jgi:acrylyl-CoA reductase (NADPH)
LSTFKAIVIEKSDSGQTVSLSDFDEAKLMEGDVTVGIEWSTVNYKDGLAITGKAPVVRRWPMIAGVDLAGTVESSAHPDWKVGDKVILNGWGLGETHLGAYAQKARVKGDWLVRLPSSMSTRDAMAIGTAGYTAMLAVIALERHGLKPESGPLVVTGAAGGVGSVAVAILAKRGFQITASTGRPEEADYLKRLGAVEIAGQGALGRWDRLGWIDDAGQRPCNDPLSRRGGCMRSCRRYGSANERGALYFAWGRPARDRFCLSSKGRPRRGLETPRVRPRSGETR